jgi:hypothetical protein
MRNQMFYHKSLGSQKIKMGGKGMRGCGMGSMLLGGSGSASALVNGATPQGMLGTGFSALNSIGLKSDGMGGKQKLKNIQFN